MSTQQAELYLWTRQTPVSADQFRAMLDSLRRDDKRIVTTNGCFDLIHPGHIRFLDAARRLGDVLVVGLNSDATVRELKGPGRPIQSAAVRAEILAGLKSVDYVVIFDDFLPIQFLELVKPAIHCKAGDYRADALPEAEVIRAHGGEIRILPAEPGYSTSQLVGQILAGEQASAAGLTAPTNHSDLPRLVLESMLNGANLLRQSGYLLTPEIIAAADRITQALTSGNKLLLCGNGGSAAEAQHIAGEFVGRFTRERAGQPAIALTTDSSILTAIANDYGYDRVFARQVEALGVPGDILIAISTSGGSKNVILAAQTARARGMSVIALGGQNATNLRALSDICLLAPSGYTPLVQQAHTAILHTICDITEARMIADKELYARPA